MRIKTVVALTTALVAAACDRPAEPAVPEAPAAPPAAATAAASASAAGAFSYAATSDLSGYYMPLGPVRIGKWSFDHVFVGQAFEFEAWRGVQSDTTFAPVMLHFDDVTSPMVQTELGESHSISARVLPTRYEVSDDRIAFEGTSAGLGAVRFEGRLDPVALATARRNAGDETVVATGTLTAGGETVRDVRLRWWMGD